MSKPLSFKESLVVWRTMAENAGARLDEMPHLRELQEALLALVERSEGLLALASRQEARLRETNRQKELAFAEGRKLRNRLADGLRGTLGRTTWSSSPSECRLSGWARSETAAPGRLRH